MFTLNALHSADCPHVLSSIINQRLMPQMLDSQNRTTPAANVLAMTQPRMKINTRLADRQMPATACRPKDTRPLSLQTHGTAQPLQQTNPAFWQCKAQ
jgi:hypothetical protein